MRATPVVSGIGPLRVSFPPTGPAQPEVGDGTAHRPIRSTIINLVIDPAARSLEDAPYAVVCLSDEPNAGSGHDHVAAIETRDPDGGSTRWTAIDVIAAIRDGERFVVSDDGRGEEALLEPGICPACSRVTLVVDPTVTRPAAC